jgi:hypothetical protein
MPDLFRVLSEYFWLVALAFSTFNYLKAERDNSASLAGEARQSARALLRVFAIAMAAPWLVMGLGQLSGSTPTVWYYFRPQDENPFVIAWLGIIFLLSCLFAWWVLLAGGASKVSELNLMAMLGHRTTKPVSENMVKFFAVLGVAIFPVWVYLAVSMNAPLPR